MGDYSQTDSSWKKMVIAKTNNEWKSSISEDANATSNTTSFSLDEGNSLHNNIKREIEKNVKCERESDITEPVGMIQEVDPSSLLIESKQRRRRKGQGSTASTTRSSRLRNMESHTHEPIDMMQEMDPLSLFDPMKDLQSKRIRQRKGSGPRPETSNERASRLSKMSAYAAQRLANETPEQRASRLKRMSEYAAKRLSMETQEQRATRLARMSAYAARRLASESPEQRQARLERMSAYAAKRHATKKSYSAADESLNCNKPNQS